MLISSFVDLISKNESNDSHFIVDFDSGLSFTQSQFIKDSFVTSSHLKTLSGDIILVGFNSYNFLVYFFAAFIAGKNIFILNPNDYENQASLFKKELNTKANWFFDLEIKTDKARMDIHLNSTIDFSVKSIDLSGLVHIPTSSTTGTSKIVPLLKSSILENASELCAHHQFNSETVIGTPLPFYHVNALFFSFFSSFINGSKLVFYKSFNPQNIFISISQYKVSHLSVIPQILHSIHRNWISLKDYDYSSLLYFISAASPLSSILAKEIFLKTNRRIIQGYGLSEIVNFSCLTPINLEQQAYEDLYFNCETPTIGIALPSNEVSIVDPLNNSLCNEYQVGEVCIKSTNAFSGYLGIDNTDFFIEHGFKTGDLGFYKTINHQKFYFLNGRIKEIAKINGESLPLKELDDLINSKVQPEFDFFLTSFENEFRGEELAIVTNEINETLVKDTVLKISSSIPLIKIKVICFVTQNFRTASGKAKRVFYRDYLRIYREKRFMANEVLVAFLN